ncbi:MAG: aryl-sulfate sulfotransferase [Bacilli bacterium]|nr:aryl-sulfate sulfotransferase [Bacilli bacterium]
MKKRLFKYVFLILITFLISISIYNYIESFEPVNVDEDILVYQKNKENEYLSNTNYSLDNPNIILNPYGNCPLSAIIVFQTKDLTTPSITIKGKNGNDLSHTYTPSKVHILPIYGLYAGYDNKVIIEVSGKKKELVIKTDDLPSDFPSSNLVTSNNTSDFYFTSFEDARYTAAYDGYGFVRWYVTGDYKWDIQRLSNGHILMSSDKTIFGNYSAGLMEMDLLGKVYYEYLIPGGYHHNVFEMSNGNLLTISNNISSKTLEDYIVEIDRNNGNIVKKIDLSDIFGNKKTGNWFKATSLFYDVNTNSITISGYNSDIIINIDYSTLNINWIIGENVPSDFKSYVLKSDGDVHLPSKPLSLKYLSDNSFAFINKNGSIIDTYKVDYSNRSFREMEFLDLNYDDDAYFELNDDYIITQNNIIKEVTDDDVSFELRFNSSLYNTKKMSLYANDIYTGAPGVRLGSLLESRTVGNYLLINSKKDDSIIKKYDIKLNKDVFGLKVSGNFNKSDNVQIILDNVLDKKTYELKDKSRYINEDGIRGKYYIYIRINGKVYKLYKYVLFN